MGYQVTLVTNPLNGEPISLVWLSLPITVLWITAIINAINMVDGLDGLASGVALIVVVLTFAVAWTRDEVLMCLVMACMGGALLGFLVYNFNPARIFLGDGGSMFIGFVLAVSAIALSQKRSTTVAVLVPVIALGLPITDVVVAVVRRAACGRPLFAADREHIHHRLLALGLSQRQAVLLLYGVSMVLAGAAFMLMFAQSRAIVILLGCVVLLVLLGLKTIGYLPFGRAALRESLGARDQNRRVLGVVRHLAERLRQADGVDAVWDTVKMIGAALEAERVTLEVRMSGDRDEEDRMLSWRRKPGPELTREGGCRVRLPLGRSTGVGHSGEVEVAWGNSLDPLQRTYEIALEQLASQLDKTLRRLTHLDQAGEVKVIGTAIGRGDEGAGRRVPTSGARSLAGG
jgi:UDP-GlcNAc:undecaprenyl-phosphate GlcNAc-1-phosphate transferase